MKKVYMMVNETYRSDGVFSTPEKAASWYYKNELKDSKDGTIKLWDGTILTLEEATADMLDKDSDYPTIIEMDIDNENTSVTD